jgi:hypothetical protein
VDDGFQLIYFDISRWGFHVIMYIVQDSLNEPPLTGTEWSKKDRGE